MSKKLCELTEKELAQVVGGDVKSVTVEGYANKENIYRWNVMRFR